MSPCVRLFYIWIFPKLKYKCINSIRSLVLWEKGIWLRKENKIKVVFYTTVLGSRWIYKFFCQPFGEVYVICFLFDFFLFMFPDVMDFHLKYWDIYISFQGEKTWGLTYCIPIYWSEINFLHGFLLQFGRFFHVIFGVPFLVECS